MVKGLASEPSYDDEPACSYTRYIKPITQLTSRNGDEQILKAHKNYTHPFNNVTKNCHTSSKLTIFHQNIRGISNKIEEFLISLSLDPPHVICLSEHHLRTQQILNINLHQYTLGASFCRKTHKHGGVCIFIPKNVQFHTINLDHFIKEKDLEICALKLSVLSNIFTIISIYRSPTGNFSYFLSHLESILNKIYKSSIELILCGDFNINYFNDDSNKQLLDSLLASFNLYSTVNFPTRISNNSCTLIDNIYINIYKHDFSVLPFINGLSDHDAQILTLSNFSIPVPKHVFSFIRRTDNDAINKFTLLLSYENWEDVFIDMDVDTIFNNFLNTYLRLFYTSFPLRKVQSTNKPKPWLTKGIKTSCANKRALYLKYRNSNDPIYKEYFKKYCRILTSVILLAKKFYYNKLLLVSNNKQRTTWNIVKTITSNKNTIHNISSLKIGNKWSSNPLDIANAFNTYFSSAAEKLLSQNFSGQNSVTNYDPLSYLRHDFSQSFPMIKLSHTTTYEIGKIIQSLKCKNSHGYDEISSRILKASTPYILSPLTLIFNKILSSGVFPERLKYSEVIPLHKKGDVTNLSNYRPVSLLTSFSKIIEKIIYKRLYSHLNDNNILVNEQFGFRDKLSTETATYALLNNVLSSLDKRHVVGGLFCDLQKAFDCVNHGILLDKMKFYGISGIANNLIKSYLDNRYQRISLNKVSSKWELVKHGVPQGSVLGPLLFLIFINDLSPTISKLANPILFADDTSIILSNTNFVDFTNNFNKVMSDTINWFQSNLLTLNYSKTHFLQFFTKKQNEIKIQFTPPNSLITSIDSTRFLGLVIDNTLSWKEHVVELSAKLNKACYAIRAIQPFMTLEVLKSVYFSYVHSVMSYGIIFWGNSHHSNNVFKIQKRIIRIITNSGRRDSCRQLYKQLQILPLPSQYILSLLVFVNKNRSLFLSNSEIHNVNTRHKDNLHLPATNLTLVQKGVQYSGSRIYNHLPQHIKLLSNNARHFKSALRSYLLEHMFYSLDEYFQLIS